MCNMPTLPPGEHLCKPHDVRDPGVDLDATWADICNSVALILGYAKVGSVWFNSTLELSRNIPLMWQVTYTSVYVGVCPSEVQTDGVIIGGSNMQSHYFCLNSRVYSKVPLPYHYNIWLRFVSFISNSQKTHFAPKGIFTKPSFGFDSTPLLQVQKSIALTIYIYHSDFYLVILSFRAPVFLSKVLSHLNICTTSVLSTLYPPMTLRTMSVQCTWQRRS